MGKETKRQKTETPEQREKRLTWEKKQIAKLEKEKQKSKPAGYIAYFIVIIAIIYMVDEITSQIGGQMNSIVAHELFAPIFGEEVASARMGLVSMITALVTFVTFLYTPLADKYGRRVFLVVNTLGMGLGMFLIGISTGMPVYLLGSVIISFFIPNDMQAVYIQECAPEKYRSTFYSVIKGIATTSLIIVPLLRRAFIPGNDYSQWRMVYLVPSVLAFVIAIIALFFVRESDVFVESRLRYLKMSEEERAAERNSKKAVQKERVGILQGAKYVFRYKQLLWIFIAAVLLKFGQSMTNQYEIIMTFGYANDLIKGGMDLASAKAAVNATVSTALVMFPVGSAIFQAIPGFFADKWGRKPVIIGLSVLSVTSFVICYMGAYQGWNASAVGFLCGSAVGCFISANDMLGLMMAESTPTHLRVSVATTKTLFIIPITMAVSILQAVLVNVLGDAATGKVCMYITVPGMVLGLIALLIKVKETKGVELK